MKKNIALFLMAILICSCAPSQSTVSTAIAQTQMAMPSPTLIPSPIPTPSPTLIPLSALDLENLLIQENDLPAGYTGGQASNILPKMFSGIAKPDYGIYQQFQKDGETSGGVAVMVYNDKNKIASAYKKIVAGMGKTQTIDGPWENGEIVNISTPSIQLEAFDMVVMQCLAVVHIRIVGTNDQRVVVTYAGRLIKRLQPFVCR